MNPSATPIDCPPGVPSRHLSGSFVKLHVAASADARFELVYPGAVLRSDGVYALSVIAAQLLVLPGEAPVRYAVVYFFNACIRNYCFMRWFSFWFSCCCYHCFCIFF